MTSAFTPAPVRRADERRSPLLRPAAAGGHGHRRCCRPLMAASTGAAAGGVPRAEDEAAAPDLNRAAAPLLAAAASTPSLTAAADAAPAVSDAASVTSHRGGDLFAPFERAAGSLAGRLWRAAVGAWQSGALPRLVVVPLFALFALKAAPALAASTLLSASVPTGGAATAASVTAPGGLFGGLSAALAGFDPAGFGSGFYSSIVLILASEIGDKTFFISALLSMKYSRTLVLIGTMLALGSMTAISVGIGQIFHALPASLNSSIPFDDYAAVALLLWFGYTNIRDALRMGAEDEEGGELADAEEVVADAQKRQATAARPFNLGALRVVLETCSLVFVAEWGDKSMLATVALAAAKNPLGVVAGGIGGHLIASIIAVIGGSLLGKYISEKNARLVGGVLFFVFAALTLFGVY